MIIQKSAPKIARPIKPSLSNQNDVENARMTYIKVGIPSPADNMLFQRTVKNLSFVIVFHLHQFVLTLPC
ncbi:MAG: hypothetical protein CL607_24000 [Anaerolineaceae bacterium]|nr:hypothetical protein [Anaerolineaceae bacterium]